MALGSAKSSSGICPAAARRRRYWRRRHPSGAKRPGRSLGLVHSLCPAAPDTVPLCDWPALVSPSLLNTSASLHAVTALSAVFQQRASYDVTKRTTTKRVVSNGTPHKWQCSGAVPEEWPVHVQNEIFSECHCAIDREPRLASPGRSLRPCSGFENCQDLRFRDVQGLGLAAYECNELLEEAGYDLVVQRLCWRFECFVVHFTRCMKC